MTQIIRKVLPSTFKKRLKSFRKTYLGQAIDNLLFELQMSIKTIRNKHKIDRFSNQSPLKLHLGCGSDIRAGWVNIDMMKPRHVTILKDATFFTYDLRRNIPLPDQSCSYIYSSHFWEHLDYYTGFKMMQDSFRVLASNGIFRIALPDFESDFRAYIEQDTAFFEVIPEQSLENIPGAETLLDYVHYAVYQFGEHKCLYDVERVSKMLTQAGFKEVRQVQFDAKVDIDEPLRTRYSFYVEAIR